MFIVNQPRSSGVATGGTSTFSVVASGTDLSYQWFGPDGEALADSEGEIEGSTTTTLRIVNAQSDDAGNYRVRVFATGGYVFSNEATLTIGEVEQR